VSSASRLRRLKDGAVHYPRGRRRDVVPRIHGDDVRRYPPREVIEDSLISAGYELTDVRGAPERPGLELVFIARKPATTS